jgi:hypothetical protein
VIGPALRGKRSTGRREFVTPAPGLEALVTFVRRARDGLRTGCEFLAPAVAEAAELEKRRKQLGA